MSAAGKHFPWQRLMDWGLHEQRLAPEQFWRSTLRELLPAPVAPPSAGLRQSLNDMMRHWPD